jgi:hypothetical protein
MISNKTAKINFRVKPNDRERLLHLADKNDLRLSELIREILKERLIKENTLIKKPN